MPKACWGRRLLALTIATALLVAGCTNDDDDGAAPGGEETTSSTAEDTSTTVIDYTQVSLAPVQGSTTTTIVIGPGEATIGGVVAGPDGPVPSASVRIERLVGDSIAVQDMATGPDGRWTAEKVLGGRYRVRAWLAPDLAMAQPVIFFLEAREQRTVDMRLEVHSGTVLGTLTDPDPPIVGTRTNLGLRLMSRLVDEQGVVRGFPLVNVEVELAGSGRWQLHSENPVVTDDTGNVAWTVTCRAEGDQPLSVVLDGGDARPLDLPACVKPEPPSTTTTTSKSTSSTSSTSSTTTTAEDF